MEASAENRDTSPTDKDEKEKIASSAPESNANTSASSNNKRGTTSMVIKPEKKPRKAKEAATAEEPSEGTDSSPAQKKPRSRRNEANKSPDSKKESKVSESKPARDAVALEGNKDEKGDKPFVLEVSHSFRWRKIASPFFSFFSCAQFSFNNILFRKIFNFF